MNLIKKDLLNKKIIIFFILMTPIIDLFNGFFDYVLQVKISPGLFVRTAILMVILYFYISQKKKNIYKVIIIGMAFLIQLLCWSWINDSEISFLSEVSFVAKIYYNIFLILVLDYYFAVKREKSYDYTEAIITSSLIITVSLIITRILGIGVSAYGVGEGYKGLFIGLNDLTIVLGIAFPFILYKAIASEERIKYVIYSVFVGGNILMIGTKTSIVVMLISILFIGYYICVKNNKRSQRVIFLVSVILGGIIFIILFRNSLEAIIERQKY
ncbi:MAG: O-antigen ligase family protein, partial [Clostridium celatum]|nr:O-antigen ligase family protein [Clostridium celatum]